MSDNLIKVTVIYQNGVKTNCEQAITCDNANPKLVSLKRCGSCGSNAKYDLVSYDPALESGVDVYGNGTLIISGTLDTFLAACATCCGSTGVVPVVPAPVVPPSATAPFTYCVTRPNDVNYSANKVSFDYLNKGIITASLFSHDVVTKTSKYTITSSSAITSFIGSDTAIAGACV